MLELLNLLLFVAWFVAFWPILRFTVGHALGLAAVMGLVTMLLVMPLLFKPNRAAKGPEAPHAALRRGSGVRCQESEKAWVGAKAAGRIPTPDS